MPPHSRYQPNDEPIPGYRLTKYIHRGRQGELWKATDTLSKKPVTVKLVPLGNLPAARSEVLAFDLLRRLNHPNLLPVHTARLVMTGGRSTGYDPDMAARPDAELLVIVMGVYGSTLEDELQNLNPPGTPWADSCGLPFEEALDYVEAAARGIDYLNRPDHGFGVGDGPIVHRNIKPANLVLVGGAVQVGDCGLATVITASGRRPSRSGTVNYMAPELLAGQPTVGTDQYALAVSYFKLRTGRLPYPEKSGSKDGMHLEQVGPPDFGHSLVGDAERQVLQHATAREPDCRYATCTAFVKQLRRAIEQAQVITPRGDIAVAELVVGLPTLVPDVAFGDSDVHAVKLATTAPSPNTVAQQTTPETTAVQPPGTTPADTVTQNGGREQPPIDSPDNAFIRAMLARPEYTDIRRLGGGGMGSVYIAYQQLSRRHEVLKTIGHQHAGSTEVTARFRREIELTVRLRHPHIVQAYSAFDVSGALVLAMEYVDGIDLGRWVKDFGRMDIRSVGLCGYQTSLGLQYAHTNGLVHRDIKPSNLIRAAGGQSVKILDLGLAKVLHSNVEGSLTSSHNPLGTPLYMAPEQSMNPSRVDIRADIYSLGCTLYYLLAGRAPFSGESTMDVLLAHHMKMPEPFDAIREDVPIELAAIVARMMAKKPDDRFQSPADAAAALEPFAA